MNEQANNWGTERMDGPSYRPRRLRSNAIWRDALADVTLKPAQLIYPMFVRLGKDLRRPVASMPEVDQWSPDRLVERVTELMGQGLQQIMLFGVVDQDEKDAVGSVAWDAERSPVIAAMQAIRQSGIGPDQLVIHADLCFCEYTDHGHCGALTNEGSWGGSCGGGCGEGVKSEKLKVKSGGSAKPQAAGTRAGQSRGGNMWGGVDNDVTLGMLAKQAVALVRGGADVVAPSGMMDGMVGAIREALDSAPDGNGNGFSQVPIMSYAIKYASSMYGPFRDAGEGAPGHGDRKGYQMDYRRSDEWAIELALDESEGADIVMVKPAGTYLDVISQVRQATALPLAAYHVSGEYSMIHAAAERGWLDLQASAIETTLAIRRAGADLVLTYFAPRLLGWMKEGAL